jgi:hypothetical protein
LGFFTERDKLANDLSHLFSLAEPREDTPEELPNVAVSEIAAAAPQSITLAAEDAFDTFPGAVEPVESTQVGFLQVALKHHLEMCSRPERKAVLERVRNIETKGEAKRYIRDVQNLLVAEEATRLRAKSKRRNYSKTGKQKSAPRKAKSRKKAQGRRTKRKQ